MDSKALADRLHNVCDVMLNVAPEEFDVGEMIDRIDEAARYLREVVPVMEAALHDSPKGICWDVMMPHDDVYAALCSNNRKLTEWVNGPRQAALDALKWKLL